VTLANSVTQALNRLLAWSTTNQSQLALKRALDGLKCGKSQAEKQVISPPAGPARRGENDRFELLIHYVDS
jgi:hypothetical protein